LLGAVLLLGMGGGYDVFAAIPLFFELKSRKAVLANLSFTFDLHKKQNANQHLYGTDKTVVIEAKASDWEPSEFDGDQFPRNYYPG
jgi:hypothetical protein